MDWLIVGGVLLLVWLRQPVLVLLGVGLLCLHLLYADGRPEYLIYDIWEALHLPELLAIPLFLFASAILARGSLGHRLVDFSVAVTRPLPGGLALGTLLALTGFASIAGSATIALLSLGPILYEALLEEDYDQPFAIGLICAGSVLGPIVPPSVAFVLYGAITDTAVSDLFIAGVAPALVVFCLFAAYVLIRYGRRGRGGWRGRDVWEATHRALIALPVPVIILGGMYSGLFSLTEAAIVAVLLALLIEVLLYREFDGHEWLAVLRITCDRLGGLVLVFGVAVSLKIFLVFGQFPQQALAGLQGTITSPVEFLLLANLTMLLLGMVLDAGSAVLVLGPLLAPLAEGFGIDAAQLGTLFILNLGLGYLTPPAGLILIAAMGVFRTNFADVVRAVLPFIGLMLVALVLVSIIPGISTYLIPQLASQPGP